MFLATSKLGVFDKNIDLFTKFWKSLTKFLWNKYKLVQSHKIYTINLLS